MPKKAPKKVKKELIEETNAKEVEEEAPEEEEEEEEIEEKSEGKTSTELKEEISDEVEKKLIELKEEEYKPKIPKEKIEEEYVLERTYIVPFKRIHNTAPIRRGKKAIRILREFIQRHMKPNEIIIHPEVNEEIWKRGIEKPPKKIRIRTTKDKEGLVYVYLA